jgi:hypothetical protein
METAAGMQLVSFGYLGRPAWQVGDDLALIQWENGRFCPRYIDHIVDFGYLPTPQRRRYVRRRLVGAVVLYVLLVALAILLAQYGK